MSEHDEFCQRPPRQAEKILPPEVLQALHDIRSHYWVQELTVYAEKVEEYGIKEDEHFDHIFEALVILANYLGVPEEAEFEQFALAHPPQAYIREYIEEYGDPNED